MSLRPPGLSTNSSASLSSSMGLSSRQMDDSSLDSSRADGLKSMGSMYGGVGGSSVRNVKNLMSQSSALKSGASFLKTDASTARIKQMPSKMSMRPGRKGKDGSSGRRSRKKRKDDTARVLLGNMDVTPKPLQHSMSSRAFHASFHNTNSAPVIDLSVLDVSVDEDMRRSSLSSSLSYTDAGSGMDDSDYHHYGSSHSDSRLTGRTVDGEGHTRMKEWTEKELKEKVNITLSESDTITLLYIPGTRIHSEDESLYESVTNSNTHYKTVIEKHKEKDKYTCRSAQTFNESQREKEVQASPPITRDAACDVQTWDIWDSYNDDQNDHQKNQEKVGMEEEEEEDEKEISVHGPFGHGQSGTGSNAPGSPTSGASAHTSHIAGRSNAATQRSFATSTSISTAGGHMMGASRISSSSSSSRGTGTDTSRSMADPNASQSQSSSRIGGPSGNDGSAPAITANSTVTGVSPLDRLYRSTGLRQALHVAEHAVYQNLMHQQHLLYRNHPDADIHTAIANVKAQAIAAIAGSSSLLAPGASTSTISSSSASSSLSSSVSVPLYDLKSDIEGVADMGTGDTRATLIPLWTYSCPAVAGMNVSCLSWNRQNTDLLAAGYGSVDFRSQSSASTSGGGGAICFWSPLNQHFYAKMIYTNHPVTSVDFCEEHPHLLAVGLYDGSVAVYDIRDNDSKPALISAHSTGKHSEPVWGVKWVSKEHSKRSQSLCSISTDGTVQQWSMKKGLVPHELMSLKRVPNRAQFGIGAAGATSGGMEGLSREASGMCFDFPINDGTQYLAGTEDGLIHKCSVSYNEQTLENFYGHTGAVYRIACSPFSADVFLSAAADWTACLWTQRHTKPVLRFQSGHDTVQDAAWALDNATVFGCVTRDGRCEVWDVSISPLDPVIKLQTGKELSCVSFAPKKNVILAGAKDGTISVYRIVGVDIMNQQGLTNEQQKEKLEKLIKAQLESKNKLGGTVNAEGKRREPKKNQT